MQKEVCATDENLTDINISWARWCSMTSKLLSKIWKLRLRMVKHWNW